MFDVTPRIFDCFLSRIKDDVNNTSEISYGTIFSLSFLKIDDLDDLLELSAKMEIPSLAKVVEVNALLRHAN